MKKNKTENTPLLFCLVLVTNFMLAYQSPAETGYYIQFDGKSYKLNTIDTNPSIPAGDAKKMGQAMIDQGIAAETAATENAEKLEKIEAEYKRRRTELTNKISEKMEKGEDAGKELGELNELEKEAMEVLEKEKEQNGRDFEGAEALKTAGQKYIADATAAGKPGFQAPPGGGAKPPSGVSGKPPATADAAKEPYKPESLGDNKGEWTGKHSEQQYSSAGTPKEYGEDMAETREAAAKNPDQAQQLWKDFIDRQNLHVYDPQTNQWLKADTSNYNWASSNTHENGASLAFNDDAGNRIATWNNGGGEAGGVGNSGSAEVYTRAGLSDSSYTAGSGSALMDSTGDGDMWSALDRPSSSPTSTASRPATSSGGGTPAQTAASAAQTAASGFDQISSTVSVDQQDIYNAGAGIDWGGGEPGEHIDVGSQTLPNGTTVYFPIQNNRGVRSTSSSRGVGIDLSSACTTDANGDILNCNE